MQWDDSINAGFNEGNKTWLKVNENYPTINVKNNLEDKDSIWYYYQDLIALRKSKEGLIYGDFKPVKANKNLMVFERIYGDEKY
jgi:glycosidase